MDGDVALMSFAGLVMAVMLTVELLRRVSRSTAQNIRTTRTPLNSAASGNRFLALPREIRDNIYEYHVLNITGKHISSPAYLGPVPLDQTELHFAGQGFISKGLDNVWHDFREAHDLFPSSKSFDEQISPELESAYLRNSTFHTTVLCSLVGCAQSGLEIRRFFKALNPAVAHHFRRLQLRFIADQLPGMVSLHDLLKQDSKRDWPLVPVPISRNNRLILRCCARDLVELLIEFGFYGRIALLGEVSTRHRIYNVTVVKLGLEVADKTWKGGKAKEEVLKKVMEIDVTVAVADQDGIPDEDAEADSLDAWRFIDVDFSKPDQTQPRVG